MSKTTLAIVVAFVLYAGVRLRAEDADSVVVPIQNTARAPIIRVQIMTGGITVHGEDRKDIAVDSKSRHRDRDRDRDRDREAEQPRADGLHRIDVPSSGFDIRSEDNVVTIKTDMLRGGGGDITLSVPRHASLELKSMAGGLIEVENVDGTIEVENLNGAIKLNDVAGSVVANSMNGSVTANLRTVDPSKPMSFSTMNGAIDVTLPADVKANISLKTDNGEILSDFDIKLSADSQITKDGPFHVRLDKTLHGSINGGGPEYKFRSFNGQIVIRKRK